VSLNLVSNEGEELIALTLGGFKVGFDHLGQVSQVESTLQLTVDTIQIDDQRVSAKLPIIFSVQDYSETPVIQIACREALLAGEMPYFNVLIQPLQLQIDEALLVALLEWHRALKDYIRPRGSARDGEGWRCHVGLVALQPIHISVTFRKAMDKTVLS